MVGDDFPVFAMVTQFGIQHVYKHLRHREPTIFHAITEYGKHLNWKPRFAELLYCWLYNVTERPRCIQCKTQPVKQFYGFDRGYSFYCSRACAAQDKMQLARREKTLKDRYGIHSPVEMRWQKEENDRS